MVYKIKPPKSSLRNNILIAFFLVIALGGVITNIVLHDVFLSAMNKQGLDKNIIEDVGRHFIIISTGLTIAGIFAVLFIAVFLSNTITGPIRKLTNGMLNIANGKWATRIEIESKDELGQLAAGFNLMAEQIENDLRKIEAAKQSLSKSEKELKKRVQELEKFYNMAVGRETKMVKLKKEIKKLKDQVLHDKHKEV